MKKNIDFIKKNTEEAIKEKKHNKANAKIPVPLPSDTKKKLISSKMTNIIPMCLYFILQY